MVTMATTAACPVASSSRNALAPQRPAATAVAALPGVCTRRVLAPLRAASASRQHRQQQRRWQPLPSICSLASSSEPAPTQAPEAPAQQLALSSFSSERLSPAVCRRLPPRFGAGFESVGKQCLMKAFTSVFYLSAGDDEAVPSLSSDAASSSSSSSGSSSRDSEEGEGKGVKIDLQLPRRSLLVQFTCNICQGRSERLVNPVAWERGMVSGGGGGSAVSRPGRCTATNSAGLSSGDLQEASERLSNERMGYYIPAAAGQANNRLPTRPHAPPFPHRCR